VCAAGRHVYFAYGLNLDRAEMEHRCPGAFFAGRAHLPDHVFQITIEGVATVVRQPGAQVHGAIWHLTDRHLATLDEFEGVEVGFYVRETKEVRQNHRAFKAQVYTATDLRLGRSRPHYLENHHRCRCGPWVTRCLHRTASAVARGGADRPPQQQLERYLGEINRHFSDLTRCPT
jgi:gamma-glutamylcyclotransferase (GGCT)/AIG2-like uncharacterized protein YtfP